MGGNFFLIRVVSLSHLSWSRIYCHIRLILLSRFSRLSLVSFSRRKVPFFVNALACGPWWATERDEGEGGGGGGGRGGGGKD